MNVRIRRLRPDIPLPRHESDLAAAFDLAAAEDVIVEPGRVALVPTGLVIEVPAGMFLGIFARSSTPVNDSPDGSVTVALRAVRAFGGGSPRPRPPPDVPKAMSACRRGPSLRAPIPLRSAVAEWHLPQPPAPLKYASPACALPVITYCSW